MHQCIHLCFPHSASWFSLQLCNFQSPAFSLLGKILLLDYVLCSYQYNIMNQLEANFWGIFTASLLCSLNWYDTSLIISKLFRIVYTIVRDLLNPVRNLLLVVCLNVLSQSCAVSAFCFK